MFTINVKSFNWKDKISWSISMGTGEWAGGQRGLCSQPWCWLWADCLISSCPAALLVVSVQLGELSRRASMQLCNCRRESWGSSAQPAAFVLAEKCMKFSSHAPYPIHSHCIPSSVSHSSDIRTWSMCKEEVFKMASHPHCWRGRTTTTQHMIIQTLPQWGLDYVTSL